MFYLGYSDSGQRLDGYSIDKVQQSRKGKKESPYGKRKKKKQATAEDGFDPSTGEEEAIKTA